MEAIAAVAAWAISYTCTNVPAASNWFGSLCTPGDEVKQLAERLSKGAEIYFPGSAEFSEATLRWSVLSPPKPNVVVVPSTAEDIAETVKFANAWEMPFLAVNEGHASTVTYGNMRHGIQIWLNQLKSVEVSADGTTAKIGGGAQSKQVIDALWASGKQTVTGSCECTGMAGPGLGGGHGFLQGRYGLISDQFLSMDVVLADGSLQTIDESSDLWWAMQGAGHNFGIVASFTSKIYDIKHSDWAYECLYFPGGDKIEELYDKINTHLVRNDNKSVEIINYAIMMKVPAIDPTQPTTMFFVLQEGAKAVDQTLMKHFHDLEPVLKDVGAGSYIDLPAWGGMDLASPPCQKHGNGYVRFPIDIKEYNPAAQRKVYDLFASAIQEIPAINQSFFLFEGYSTQAVQAVPSDSTAYPFRDDNLLLAPIIVYTPDGPELDKKAAELGKNLRQILHEGSGRDELHTYVNYAFGEETLENMYGYEQWRQNRLKALKKKYDPKGRFNFYAPIA